MQATNDAVLKLIRGGRGLKRGGEGRDERRGRQLIKKLLHTAACTQELMSEIVAIKFERGFFVAIIQNKALIGYCH